MNFYLAVVNLQYGFGPEVWKAPGDLIVCVCVCTVSYGKMEGGGLIKRASLPSSHGAMHLGWEGDEKVPLALLDNPSKNKLVRKTTSAICKTILPSRSDPLGLGQSGFSAVTLHSVVFK